MKGLITQNFKILKYTEEYYSEVIENLYHFALKNKMPGYDKIFEYTDKNDQLAIVRDQFANDMNDSTHSLISYDLDRNAVQWFGCFYVESKKCDAHLVFNPVKYDAVSSTRQCEAMMDVIRKLSGADYVSAKLARSRIKAYVRYIQMQYNIKVLPNNIDDPEDQARVRFYPIKDKY